jgi:hypothetical protein
VFLTQQLRSTLQTEHVSGVLGLLRRFRCLAPLDTKLISAVVPMSVQIRAAALLAPVTAFNASHAGSSWCASSKSRL